MKLLQGSLHIYEWRAFESHTGESYSIISIIIFITSKVIPFLNCFRIISVERIRIWVRPQYHDYFFLQMIFFEGITLLVDTIKSLQRKWSQHTHKNMLLIHTSTNSTLLWRLFEQGKKVGIKAATATEAGYSKCCQEIVCNIDINYD